MSDETEGDKGVLPLKRFSNHLELYVCSSPRVSGHFWIVPDKARTYA